MKVCPNIRSAEWVALEAAVGRFEAMRDWMDNDNIIRDPALVLEKLRLRDQAFSGHTTDLSVLKPVYSAVFLPSHETERLKKLFPPVFPSQYYHHSTIAFKPADISDIEFGNYKKLKVIGRITTDKVDALLVESPKSKNKYPHITLSVANGVKPFESNAAFENNPDKIVYFSKPVMLDAVEGINNGKKDITSLTQPKINILTAKEPFNFNYPAEVNDAVEFAKEAHGEQNRKYTGIPYYIHLEEVAAKVSEYTDDLDIIRAAVLHDVLEDTPVVYSQVEEKFGKRVADIVQELTDEFTKENYPDLNRKGRKSKEADRLSTISDEAKLIKAADKLNNIQDIAENDAKFAVKYLAEAKEDSEAIRSNTPLYKKLEVKIADIQEWLSTIKHSEPIDELRIIPPTIAVRTNMIVPAPKNPNSVVEQMLLDSGAIKWRNDVLYILKHRYAEAMNAIAEVNKKYGKGTAKRVPVPDRLGGGGRVIDTVEVVEPMILDSTEEGTTSYLRDLTPMAMNENATDNIQAREMIDKLSKLLGVDYAIISSEQALKLEPNWKGEVGFYKKNVVYFVGDKIRTDTVFHEFAHPFLRAIANTNPKLFNMLYAKLALTEEGKKITAEVVTGYPEYDKKGNMFKEEVLVRALTVDALNKLKAIRATSPFINAIKELLYAIKQYIRKIFGAKVGIEGLKSNTSLSDLANILVRGKTFTLEVRPVTESEIAAYKRHAAEDIAAIKNIPNEAAVKIINLRSAATFKWYKRLAEDKRYEAPAEALGIKNSELEQVLGLLSNFRSGKDNEAQFQKKIQLLQDSAQRRGLQAAALMSSLLLADKSADTIGGYEKDKVHIEGHLEKLAKDIDNKNNISQMIYYKYYVSDWINNANEIVKILEEYKVPKENPLYKQVVLTRTKLESARNKFSAIFSTNTFSVMKDMLDTLKDGVDTYYRKKREDYIKKGATKATIDELDANYEKDKLTDDKYRDIIKGSGTDANRFNSYMETYMNNQDPAIMGLTAYIQRGIHQYLSTIQLSANNMKLKLAPILTAVKWNRSNIASLSEKVAFEDFVWMRNPETQKLEKKKVIMYLNEFQGASADEAGFIQEISDMEKDAKAKNEPAEANIWKEIRTKRENLAKWRTDYKHQEKKPEFYARYNIFANTDIRREAKMEMDDFYDEREIYEKNAFEEGFTEIEEDALWKSYEQRERQMFNEFYPDGKMKEGDELLKVQIRKEYRTASRGLYDYVLKPRAFQLAREQYQEKLALEGVMKENPATADEYTTRLAEWDSKNLRKKLKNDPAEEIKELTDRLRVLNSKISAEYKEKSDIAIPYDKIADIEKQHKDIDYQTNASELSPGERNVLKDNQEKINHLRSVFKPHQRLDLSEEELAEYETINIILAGLRSTYPSEYYLDSFNSFLENKNGAQIDPSILMGSPIHQSFLTKETADKITNLPSVIERLKVDGDRVAAVVRKTDPNFISFRDWFDANHLKREKFETIEGVSGKTTYYERLWAWNLKEVNDPNAYETTDILDENDNIVETLQGAPATRYYNREVKKEFLTGYNADTGKVELEVGKHVDNRGNFLPLTMELGAKDAKYRNQRYYDLKESTNPEDITTFKAIEAIKAQSLEIQEGLDNIDKIWYEHPRFTMSNLEIMQHTGITQGVSTAWKEFVAIFKRTASDQEDGYNATVSDGIEGTIENVKNEEKIKMLSNNLDLKMATVGGTYNMDIDRVSRDIPAALLKYMASATRNKQFKQMLPTVTAFQLVFSDPERAQRELQGIGKSISLNNAFVDPNDKTTREKAINFLINREFKGQMLTGPGYDNKGFNAVINLMFGAASSSFFALNIPGALQNQIGPIFQGVAESFSGKFWNPKNLGVGIAWGYKTMSQITLHLTGSGPKPLDVQIAELLDIGAGNFEKSVGESMSRALGKDAASLSWLMSFRKWTETQATLALGGATLDHITLTRQMPDGTTTQVSYLKAWELDKDGKIKLLDGINPEFAGLPINHTIIDGDTVGSLSKKYFVTEDRIRELNDLKTGQPLIGQTLKISKADEFSKVRSLIHEFSRRNQGAYSSWEQAQLNSDTIGRIVMFMKKFFLPMFMDRWAFKGNILNPRPRYSLATGEMTQGYYITILDHLAKAIKNLNVKLLYTSETVDNGMARRAYTKLLTELVLLYAMTLLYGALFGWDPKDKQRYEKLRKKSGPLPTPFTVDDPQHPFHFNGWMSNHALSLLMRVKNENSQLIPWPGMGLDNHVNMLSLKSYVMGPTVEAVADIATDLTKMANRDPSAYYQVGPGTYTWNQTGAPKVLQDIAVMFGFTNKDAQPTLKIKSLEDNERNSGKR